MLLKHGHPAWPSLQPLRSLWCADMGPTAPILGFLGKQVGGDNSRGGGLLYKSGQLRRTTEITIASW